MTYWFLHRALILTGVVYSATRVSRLSEMGLLAFALGTDWGDDDYR